MDSEQILQRNLLALSPKNPLLTKQIAHAEPSRNCDIVFSRNGYPVPAIQYGGKKRHLHSMVDPVREGERTASTYAKSGYFIILGLGCGYHITPLLDHEQISYILIIENDISMCKTILSQVNLSALFLNVKVNLLIDDSPGAIKNFLLSNYFPAISGNLHTLYLRTRYEMEKKYFDGVLSSLEDSISTLGEDYSVQAYFGKKWFSNSIANLHSAEKSTTVLQPVTQALVTGAGPSLDTQIDDIRKLKTEGICLIATDTSLPALLSSDITPDIVISIDCQHITFHHFISGFPDVPLVLDLASPPFLTRLTKNLVFFTSGHPFSHYVNSHWRRFPFIDTSGGNVSHAAVSLAESLGASVIYLAGADFSYPGGKSYARGTYLYNHFGSREYRLDSLENRFIHFLFRNRNVDIHTEKNLIRYTTKPMISYKKRLEIAAGNIDSSIQQLPGNGVPLQLDSAKKKPRHHNFSALFSAGSFKQSWKSFLEDYDRGLNSLSIPDKTPVSAYFSRLSLHERDLWTTLLPAAAAIRRESGDAHFSNSQILECVRSWTSDSVRRTIDRFV